MNPIDTERARLVPHITKMYTTNSGRNDPNVQHVAAARVHNITGEVGACNKNVPSSVDTYRTRRNNKVMKDLLHNIIKIFSDESLLQQMMTFETSDLAWVSLP
jgi:hypothetical protein